MPKKDEELKVKEQQSESLVDSKKIDLYINNNEDEAKGISIMNVFSRLKQRFHIYIWVVLICLLTGLLAPTLMYTFKDKKESAVAIISLDYAGAVEGKAPDGSDLDITYLKSSYIIQNALNSVTLSKEVSAPQVISNLTITGVLTDETKRQMEILNALKESDKNGTAYADFVQSFVKTYRPQYIVSLSNGFADADGKNKVKLSSEDLSHLLSAITKAYNDFYVETYQDVEMPINEIDAINVDFLDYLEILDKVSTSLNNLQAYCDNRSGLMPGFRASNGLSFSDLSSMISTLKAANINDLYAYIYLNNVCKNKKDLIDIYTSRKIAVQNQLDVVIAEIANTEMSMANCEEDIRKVKTTGGAEEEIKLKSEKYNSYVIELMNLNSRKSSLEEEIALLDYRINTLNGPEASATEKAAVETEIDEILARSLDLYNLTRENSSELFNSNGYQNRYMHAVTTYESERLSDNVKLFLLGAALGLFVGLAAWVIDAFVLEFKAIKKNSEELEEAK